MAKTAEMGDVDPELHGIIKNEAVLFSNYTEELFFKREVEEKLFSELRPIAEKQRCENLFAFGPTGAGKTPLIKSILNAIRNCNPSVVCLYINCWHYRTSAAIYAKIADAIGAPASRRGRAKDELFDGILQRMRADNIGVLLALDDIDGLIYNDDTQILHNIARVTNNCARFGVIGISEDKQVIEKLDSRILDSLRFVRIEINGYSKDQLLELLFKRAEIGLQDGTYTKEVLERVAEHGIENKGNGRLVLEILRRAAKITERKKLKIITHAEVEEAAQWICKTHSALSEEEQMIVGILRLDNRNSSEIYWLFNKQLLRSKRQIRNYLDSLIAKGIIEVEFIKEQYNYGSRIFKLTEGWHHE